MISKELFVEMITAIQEHDKENETITKGLEAFCEGNGFFFDGGNRLLTAHLHLLETVMHDTEEQWISWWLWESDNDKKIWMEDEKSGETTEVILDTPEHLYDFLKQNERRS